MTVFMLRDSFRTDFFGGFVTKRRTERERKESNLKVKRAGKGCHIFQFERLIVCLNSDDESSRVKRHCIKLRKFARCHLCAFFAFLQLGSRERRIEK
jgi:hypothetical protein